MEFLIFLLLVALIAFLIIRGRWNERRRHDIELSKAWRMVLDDPHYEHRRRYEEKLRQDDRRLRKEHASLRSKEGLSGEVPPETEGRVR